VAMRIDAHQHYWKLERGDYNWLTPGSGSLYRDYLPDNLKPLLAKCGIQKTIVVQAAPTIAETEFLLALAEKEPTIAGVVGWINLESDIFSEQLARLRKHPKFVGIRPMLQDLPEDDWILKDTVLKNVSILVEENFPLDILVFPRHLPHIIRLLEHFPNLIAVVDHLAKPYIKDQVFEPWRENMAKIGKYPGVMCKLSGMVTEADHVNWKPDDLRPYVEHVLCVFGLDRVMFGSDWPVCTLAADYETVYRTLHDILPGNLSENEFDLVFGKNAAKFYRLG
jgi:L-fuconolactonase